MEKRYCPNCGARLSKTARCCVECGEFLEALPDSASNPNSREAISLAQTQDFNDRMKKVFERNSPTPPSEQHSAPEITEKPAKPQDAKSLGLFGLMGLQILFFFPIIGLIAAIVFCARKNTRPAVKLQAKARIGWAVFVVAVLVIFLALYELWLRQFLLSHDILGISFGNLKLYFSELTLTRLFG